jgi:hypothetical protein
MGQPQRERSRLGFAAVASEEFRFLSQSGFRLVELSDTLARYETDHRFVRVFHGRGSYELGVEIGRWIEVNGELREQFFPLREVIDHQVDPGEVGYGGLAATDAQLVRKFVHQLGVWTRQFAMPLLTDGDQGAFSALSKANAQHAERHRDAVRASRLRAKADEAWRIRDLETVANFYSEIENELTSVELKRFERSRLRYALKALNNE